MCCFTFTRLVRSNQASYPESKLCLEGVKKSKSKCVGALFSNFYFEARLWLFQIVLVSLQQSPYLCIAILNMMTILSTFQFVHLYRKHHPWSSINVFLQKLGIEITLMILLLSVAFKSAGIYYLAVDYVVVGLAFLCIVALLINFVTETFVQII